MLNEEQKKLVKGKYYTQHPIWGVVEIIPDHKVFMEEGKTFFHEDRYQDRGLRRYWVGKTKTACSLGE